MRKECQFGQTMKDEIFKTPQDTQFDFNDDVVSVFDDMLVRSVPFYETLSKLQIELISRLGAKNSSALDLGSSTGTFLISLWQRRKDMRLKGIDSSKAMIKNAKQKKRAIKADIKFVCEKIENFNDKNIDFIISNYTLQFIRPAKRQDLVSKIYKSLQKGGSFILSEKIVSKNKKLSKQMIEIYHNYKKQQGYSDYEIATKRKALENVLVPYTDKENQQMLLRSGFKHVEVIFRWNNFASYLAIK